jgi:acetaldehyde dehydrogenase (acetylating)
MVAFGGRTTVSLAETASPLQAVAYGEIVTIVFNRSIAKGRAGISAVCRSE